MADCSSPRSRPPRPSPHQHLQSLRTFLLQTAFKSYTPSHWRRNSWWSPKNSGNHRMIARSCSARGNPPPSRRCHPLPCTERVDAGAVVVIVDRMVEHADAHSTDGVPSARLELGSKTLSVRLLRSRRESEVHLAVCTEVINLGKRSTFERPFSKEGCEDSITRCDSTSDSTGCYAYASKNEGVEEKGQADHELSAAEAPAHSGERAVRRTHVERGLSRRVRIDECDILSVLDRDGDQGIFSPGLRIDNPGTGLREEDEGGEEMDRLHLGCQLAEQI
ncbi:hypothetical protein PHLCEN_2v2751 [Hermanssonia centrifuga]|uniref:Uncharacterized protein n=1 Tax=Hermanssonia centrifuga TaxID=98765 RepID=A0A2R6RHV9_9APHY|nr:hypothetical protein PHLCEN_2v2751 [Hermanssonia centrifuga]